MRYAILGLHGSMSRWHLARLLWKLYCVYSRFRADGWNQDHEKHRSCRPLCPTGLRVPPASVPRRSLCRVAPITNNYKVGSLNSKNISSHHSNARISETKVLAGLHLLGGALLFGEIA